MQLSRRQIKLSPALPWIAAIVLTLSGCVTETTGGIPGPAPTEARVQAQLELARGYLEQREFGRARPALKKALEVDPKHVETHVLSAVLYQSEKEYELAEQHYLLALKIEPKNSQALMNYGTFLYSRGRYGEAVPPLSRLVKDTDYHARPQAFESLGLVQLKNGDAVAAEAAFTRSLELNFRQARSTLELADIAYKRGDHENAAARLLEYRTMARQNSRSLCLGLKVARATDDQDQVASNAMALKNLFPEQAVACQAGS